MNERLRVVEQRIANAVERLARLEALLETLEKGSSLWPQSQRNAELMSESIAHMERVRIHLLRELGN